MTRASHSLTLFLLQCLCLGVSGFQPILVKSLSRVALEAGGFEWDDPTDSAFDQGVENPFKNPDLTIGEEEGMKIDPARLLGPRLNGSNLYFIGMMGSGKTAVSQIVAKRTSTKIIQDITPCTHRT